MIENKVRCFGNGNAIYEKYHDNEWGYAEHNENKLFEMLILEGAQAGLNWLTILKKRQYYRDSFYNFDVNKVAAMTDSEMTQLLSNSNIIRNRAKIFSARSNAQAFQQIQQQFGSFDNYIWQFVDYKTIYNHWEQSDQVPTQTNVSQAISQDLKKRGMKFVGPVIIYSYMQAIGMVNDHIKSCWRYEPSHLNCQHCN